MSPEYHTSNNPQSAPVNFQMGSVFQNKDRDNDRSSPPFNTHGSQIQFASFSADHATSYARMQYRPKVNSKLEHSPRLPVNRPGPYTVLPNIEDQNKGSDELRKSDPDGYLAKMQKSKQGPQYKQYTLKDYQKLKVDTKLGGLGPDTEAAQIKQEKVMRQREYAKLVMMQNRKAFQKSKAPGWIPQQPSPQDRGLTKRDIVS
ncbi:jhy protein homolog [Anneissia japonica]|uniref:jhy protein homolog n=1 Tax=Anneissia japonica TaxID=1529436 RepID=UPI0014259B71|nr:jhy protein homolog [Anneissia japonica]